MSVPAATTSFLNKSDVAAAISGAVFKYVFPSMDGSVSMVAIRSGLISIVARVLSANNLPGLGSFSEGQKNELLIAVMGGLATQMQGKSHNWAQGAVGHVSIDLLADQLIALFGMADASLLNR